MHTETVHHNKIILQNNPLGSSVDTLENIYAIYYIRIPNNLHAFIVPAILNKYFQFIFVTRPSINEVRNAFFFLVCEWYHKEANVFFSGYIIGGYIVGDIFIILRVPHW